MTESEWISSNDPVAMLHCIQYGFPKPTPTGLVSAIATDRKLRLFACACCRHAWDLLTDERCRLAIEVAERYADGGRTKTSMLDFAWRRRSMNTQVSWTQVGLAYACCIENAAEAAYECHCEHTLLCSNPIIAHQAQVDLLRCLFGVPHRPVNHRIEVDRLSKAHQQFLGVCRHGHKRVQRPGLYSYWLTWNDGAAVKIARDIYNRRAWDETGALADCLVEAGCDNEDVLEHLCSPGPHARGCWVVDSVLGKK